MLFHPPRIEYNINKTSYGSKGSFTCSVGFSEQYTSCLLHCSAAIIGKITAKLSHILETEFTVFYFWKSFDSASVSVTGLNPTISGMYYFHPFAQYFPLFIFPSIKLNL